MNAITKVTKGERIFFKPEWQDKGDADVIFLAMEDSDSDSVPVVAMLGLTFNPWHHAKLHMIERTEPFLPCAS